MCLKEGEFRESQVGKFREKQVWLLKRTVTSEDANIKCEELLSVHDSLADYDWRWVGRAGINA